MKDYWYDKVEVSIFLCGRAARRQLLRRRGDEAAEGPDPAELESPALET